jgi:hypothetical protein
MAKSRLSCLFAFALCLSCALPSSIRPAFAHGVGWSQGTAESVVLTFYYVGGGPMVDADARIFGPDGADPFQTLRTDGMGRLSFNPDRPGQWRAQVVDAEGHEVTASITADKAGAVSDPSVGLTGAILLSLTANLVLGIGLWRRRRRPLDASAPAQTSASAAA